MNYKIKGAIRRNRNNFIIFAIIWLLIAFVLIPPITYSGYAALQNGPFDLTVFIETYGTSFSKPLTSLGKVFVNGAVGSYISQLLIGTIIYSVFFFIGFVKSAPKNEYTDIEHGSSDWSQRGEQYSILNKHKGIILARDNYLPVDKRGNVNVLVVGRFRFW